MDKKLRAKLLDLCVEIYACNELDYEVTLSGNGTNASEAANVAGEILDIIGVKRKDREFKRKVAERAKEMKTEYGEDDEEVGEEILAISKKEVDTKLVEPVKKLIIDREESEDDYNP